MLDTLSASPAGGLSDFSLWRSMGALVLVLALMVAAVWFLRKLQRGGIARKFGSALDMEIVGHLPLAQKQYLSVVRVGAQHWVLGITEQSVQYLGQYQGQLPQPKSSRGGMTSFATMLEKAGFKFNKELQRSAVATPESTT
jgi:flagellar biosynthetic protein FliO